jgi:hypothetical protein
MRKRSQCVKTRGFIADWVLKGQSLFCPYRASRAKRIAGDEAALRAFPLPQYFAGRVIFQLKIERLGVITNAVILHPH